MFPRRWFTRFSVLLLFLLAGCGPLFATPTASPTPRPTLTATLTPTLTPSPTPVTAALLGTPPAAARTLLSAQTVGQIKQLARWGVGIPRQALWSPDGKQAAVITSSGVLLLDGDSLAVIRVLASAAQPRSAAYSPDGSRLAVGYDDGRIRLWEPAAGKVRQTLGAPGPAVVELLYSPDSARLVASDWNGRTLIWRLDSVEEPERSLVEGGQPLSLLRALPDGTLFGWTPRAPLQTWSLADGKAGRSIYLGKDDLGYAPQLAAVSPSGEWIAAGSERRVRLIRASDGYTLAVLSDFTAPLTALTFTPGGSLLTAENGRLRLWSVPQGRLLGEAAVQPAESHLRLALSPDGRSLLGLGEQLHRWTLSDSSIQPADSRDAGFGPAYPQAGFFSPDSASLTVQLANGSFIQRRMAGGDPSPLQLAPGAGVTRTVVSPDLSLAAGSGADTRVRVWRTADGQALAPITTRRRPLGALAFAPQNDRLAVGVEDNTLTLWSLPEGKLLWSAPTPALLRQVTWSPDGSWLMGRINSQFLLWRAADGSLLQTFEGYGFTFSADGKGLALATAGGGNPRIELRRLPGGELTGSLKTAGGALCFSPDGSLLAVSAVKLKLWDVSTGKLAAELDGPAPYAHPVFSGDGRWLALLGWDGRTDLWGIP